MPSLLFLGLYSWPFVEKLFSSDKGDQNVLRLPYEQPILTAGGAGLFTFLLVLLVAGGDDFLALARTRIGGRGAHHSAHSRAGCAALRRGPDLCYLRAAEETQGCSRSDGWRREVRAWLARTRRPCRAARRQLYEQEIKLLATRWNLFCILSSVACANSALAGHCRFSSELQSAVRIRSCPYGIDLRSGPRALTQ